MTTLIATTVTLYPSPASSSLNSSLASPSRAPTTVTHLVTRTLASDEPTGVPLGTFDSNATSASGLTIGLAIGLPVGLFCLGLLVFLFYFYWRGSVLESSAVASGSREAENHMNEKSWLPNLIYGGRDADDNSSYLNVKRLPSVSSKIQYRISRAAPQHILTPKAPLCRESHGDPLAVNDEVDTFLYSRPPNIYHIDSKMPSTNNLANGSKVSVNGPHSISSSTGEVNPLRRASRKWSYQSPLSRWFLRSSTYLQDGLTLPMSIKTPTVQLKQLKILSRINKEYANSWQFVDDEKSPILDRMDDCSDEQGSLPSAMDGDGCAIQKPSSGIYGTIDPQTFEVRDEAMGGDRSLKLGPAPSNIEKGGKNRRQRRQSRLRQHLQQISNVKPLPVIPKSTSGSHGRFQIGRVYKVVQEYKARLTDEICIEAGEFVKMLATHTDGWCLVEKCTKDGVTESICEDRKDINDKSYLNDDRGIIPGDCLQQAK
ncbi:hypothetical protein HG536_0B00680 [Torulaspora globosa]|uniref:SH3 domain-containing protein n=1 Tax=Torulaspora globosa TaxID=48254 RepID=A0A7G3ZCH1_9SACH|nr:uncharacterized protein HG536_0B00680 [Torulaspora globosa]QLL31207.1 hypothetical protein HG536_0B00680 [Torulaspora globosa]